jgi:hypothetical protein
MLAEQQMATFTNGGILNCSSGEGREPPLVDQLSFLSFCSEEMLSPYVNSASYAGPCSHVSCREQLLGGVIFCQVKWPLMLADQ